MIVDSSAVLAIAFGEADAPVFLRALATASSRIMSAANWFDAAMVAEGRAKQDGGLRFDALVASESIEAVDVTMHQAQIARQAWRDLGRGRHRAALNYGDCFAYALAKERGEPLLFKGNDFIHTDITPALKG